MKLDETDRQILNLLRANAKRPTRQIAKTLNIPITTVHNRIKRLEKLEVIKGYTVIVDHKKLGDPISAIILCTVSYEFSGDMKKNIELMAAKIRTFDEVEEVVNVTGIIDTVVKVRISSIDDLNDFLHHKLRRVNMIDKTQTLIALKSWEHIR